MGNLIALLTHTQRGHEIIVEEEAHIVRAERAYAYVGGLEVCWIKGCEGVLDARDVEEAILTSRSQKVDLLCLENTHLNAGGVAVGAKDVSRLCDVAHRYGIQTHLDGARIFNASVALGTPVDEIAKDTDSLMFCLSKGLCAPVGSILAGSEGFVERAREIRRMLGGQMRQAGVIAAAGIVALEKMIDRLREDHENARLLANGLAKINGIRVDPNKVQTNVVFFDVRDIAPSAKIFATELFKEWNIKIDARKRTFVRAVTYRDVSRANVEYFLNAVRTIASGQISP
jgi:threonine aldolase